MKCRSSWQNSIHLLWTHVNNKIDFFNVLISSVETNTCFLFNLDNKRNKDQVNFLLTLWLILDKNSSLKKSKVVFLTRVLIFKGVTYFDKLNKYLRTSYLCYIRKNKSFRSIRFLTLFYPSVIWRKKTSTYLVKNHQNSYAAVCPGSL